MQRQELGSHQATGAVVGVQEQRANHVGVFHAGQHRPGSFERDVTQEVSRLVGFHLVHDANDRLGGQGCRQLGGLLVIHFLQDVGRVGGVQLRQERDLSLGVQFGKEIGLVGGTQGFDDGRRRGQVIILQGGMQSPQDVV